MKGGVGEGKTAAGSNGEMGWSGRRAAPICNTRAVFLQRAETIEKRNLYLEHKNIIAIKSFIDFVESPSVSALETLYAFTLIIGNTIIQINHLYHK